MADNRLIPFAALLAGGTLLTKLPVSQTPGCEVCTYRSQAVCEAFKQVRDKAIAGGMTKVDAETVVHKLCEAIPAEPTLLNLANTLNTKLSTGQVKQFLTDINPATCPASEACAHFSELTASSVTTWLFLLQNQSSQALYARKYWPTLTTFSQLTDPLKVELVKFSDKANTTSTLKEFSDDLINTNGFVDFLNQHVDFAKGFVGHKQSPLYTVSDYEVLDEALKDIPISADLLTEIVAWLAYSKEDAQRRNYYQQGKDFENRIGNELRSSSSAVYQTLKSQYIPDLDQRQILSQVQFCINTPVLSCSGEGEYFIADFVFVKEGVDRRGNPIWDVIVADTKLQSSTAFTANQKQAMGKTSYQIKVGKPVDINGVIIDNFTPTTNLPIIKTRTKFLKIYSNGSGGFGNITE